MRKSVQECAQYPSGHARYWRLAAADSAQQFFARHNMLDTERLQMLAALRNEQPIVRVSHQPNLFAGLNIAGLLIAAEKLAEESDSIIVFVAIDYDAAGDQRFRSSLLPPVNGRCPVRLNGGVPRADRSKAAFTLPVPPRDVVGNWVAAHTQAIARYGKRFGAHPARLSNRRIIEELRRNANSFTDFNLALLVHLCRRILHRPVIFVAASQCLGRLDSRINALVSRMLTSDPRCATTLVWRVCDRCYRRCHTELLPEAARIYCQWQCVSCDEGSQDVLDWRRQLAGAPHWPAFVPKVLLCDLIDYRIIRAEQSVGYARSLEHLAVARSFYERHIRLPVLPPEYIWRPTRLLLPAAQELDELWRAGRFSSYLYHDVFGARAVRKSVVGSLSVCLRRL